MGDVEGMGGGDRNLTKAVCGKGGKLRKHEMVGENRAWLKVERNR